MVYCHSKKKKCKREKKKSNIKRAAKESSSLFSGDGFKMMIYFVFK